MKKIFIYLLLSAVVACNHPDHKHEVPKMETIAVKDTVAKKLKDLVFAVKKDLVCGMPVSAGISDTALYKGKLYGFCSGECKDDFLKDPKKYLMAK